LVKGILRIVLSGFVLSLGLTASMAQTPTASTDTKRRPFYLTAGGLVPFSGDAVKLGGVTYTSVALSYFPTGSTTPALNASGHRLGFRVDYARGQSSNGEVSSVGISPVYQRAGGTLRGNRVLYGASLGLFNTRARNSETDETKSGYGLGGRLFAGMEFTNNVLLEVSLNEFPAAMGARPRGIGVQIGTRF
jgi:hypothetical protein